MIRYKEAGVDIDAGTELVKRLQKLCPEIGGFGGLYPFGDNYLVASTDGVGTKLKVAFAQGRHDTIGIDLVAMCVNDILTSGARPLFFLDYFATSKLDVDQAEQVLSGVIKGCQEAGCVLLGGETAEMPGFYQPGEYDISGFAVGVVSKKDLIDGSQIKSGDALVGIASKGLHSNGFSLARKVLKELHPELLTPTRIYVQKVHNILQRYTIKGMAHITGGGITGNVPRMLPDGLDGRIKKGSWNIPSIFHTVQTHVEEDEMYRTFNMGVGMVLALDPEDAQKLCDQEEDCFIIGEVVQT